MAAKNRSGSQERCLGASGLEMTELMVSSMCNLVVQTCWEVRSIQKGRPGER